MPANGVAACVAAACPQGAAVTRAAPWRAHEHEGCKKHASPELREACSGGQAPLYSRQRVAAAATGHAWYRLPLVKCSLKSAVLTHEQQDGIDRLVRVRCQILLLLLLCRVCGEGTIFDEI